LIGILAVTIGLIFFAISRFLGVPFWEDFIFAIGIIVAMVPEGLLPTLTLALDTPEIIFARAGADQKRRIVDALKRKGQVVAATVILRGASTR
jgi:magnesium-transporting ATPase (P-type)